MRVRIQFIRFGSNSAIGGFSPGDRMSCDSRMADHLVNEAKVAKFIDAPAPALEPAAPEPPQEATTKKRRAKA